LVRKNLKKELDKVFGNLTQDFASFEGDPEKIEKAKVY
jgi:hypothetical protein